MNLRRDPRPTASHRSAAWASAVTVRLAGGEDAGAISRVAARDSRPVPEGPHLVAFRDDELVAVLSLADGSVVADPFRRTAEIVELLRLHAGDRRLAAPATAGVPAATGRPPARRLGLAGGCP